MKVLVHIATKRKLNDDKDTIFLQSGRVIDPLRLETFKRQKMSAVETVPSSAPTPEHVTYYTPDISVSEEEVVNTGREHGIDGTHDTLLGIDESWASETIHNKEDLFHKDAEQLCRPDDAERSMIRSLSPSKRTFNQDFNSFKDPIENKELEVQDSSQTYQGRRVN